MVGTLSHTLAALLFLAVHVQAGSHAWEASLQHPEPVQHKKVEVDAAGYAIRSETTTKRINKRYVGLWPTDFTKLWPEKTVSYCFATKEGRSKNQKYIREAAKMWHRAGLHRDVYKWKEVADPGPDTCVGNSDRAGILVINEQPDNRDWSDATVGVEPVDADEDPAYTGPNLNIGSRADVSTRSKTAVVAHEMGHVWGLHHEHQYRGFWNAPYNSWPGSDVFGDNFACAKLEDFSTVLQEIRDGPDPQDEQRMCTWKSVAGKYGFSASQFLPVKDNTKTPFAFGQGKHYSDVDWDSIMLYDTYAYGINGNAVLLRNDGLDFDTNAIPSEGDVAGIRALYEDAAFRGQTYPTLPNNTKNPRYTKFLDMFRKTKDDC